MLFNCDFKLLSQLDYFRLKVKFTLSLQCYYSILLRNHNTHKHTHTGTTTVTHF